MTVRDRVRGDERGQAITLNYALGLSISVLLVTGLLIGGASFVRGQQEQAARTQLNVIGQQVSADLATADRLAVSTEENSTVTLRRSLPDRVAGSSYKIELVNSSDPYLELRTVNPEVVVTIKVAMESNMEAATVNGGKVRIGETASGNITLESGGGA